MMDLQPDPQQRRRMILAVGLAAVVLLASDLTSMYFTGHHAMGMLAPNQDAPAGTMAAAGTSPVATATSLPGAPATPSSTQPPVKITLENADLTAQVNPQGATLDTLTLKQYAEKLGEPAGYELLKPLGPNLAYVEAGWLGSGLQGPDANTPWQVIPAAASATTAVSNTVNLAWRNASGQAFERTIALTPDSYVFTVTDRLVNTANLPVTFTHYAQVQEADGFRPEEKRSSWVNYYGPLGWVKSSAGDGKLVDTSYSDLAKLTNGPGGSGKSDVVTGTGGWWGLTGQYFMTVIAPLDDTASQRDFRHASQPSEGGNKPRDFYTAALQQAISVPPGGQASVSYLIYAGPKSYRVLKPLGHQLEQAIPWGWFEPLVKILNNALIWFHSWLHNWGFAVIALTLCLKLLAFPLANKSYHAMAKMKRLQPKIEALKKQHEGDQQAVAMATMQLYQKEKVNPMGGCWPMLIQIPLFFAMYKTVLLSFEFRHAPLGLWIHDMSAHDPFFVLPVLMGISMMVQMRLQPQSADPAQAALFRWMPVLFTVMFLFFPSGLVLYWLTNNLLSIAQQYVILQQEKRTVGNR